MGKASIVMGASLLFACALRAQPPSVITPPPASSGAPAGFKPAPGEEDIPPIEETPLPPIPEIELPALPPADPVKPLTFEQYREGAFKAAQWAFRTDAAVALDRLAARFAGGGDAVGRLESELQMLAQDLRAAERAVSEAFQRQGPTAEAERTKLRKQAEALEIETSAKASEIQTRFPRYSELVRPQAYDFETVRALLRPDEAVLLIVNADDATYIFAVSSERYQWFRSTDLARPAVEAAVARLRESLDAPPEGPFGSSPSPDQAGVPPFDRRLAHRLYRGLIEPASEIIGGKRVLMTITSGVLATLPLGVLVTEAPSGADGDAASLAATRWLADGPALATLPSISSLIALRCLLVENPLRGAGCPRHLGASGRTQPSRAPSLTLAGAGAPSLLGSTVARRRGAGAISDIFHDRRQRADPEYLRQRYAPLRWAKAELQALKRQYGKRAHILVDAGATERAVKEDPAFRSARYVVFATHGVLAARADTYGEPGLVFTPPAAGKEDEVDDGFLGASEVAQLRFNTNFVVLSACNTASSDGQPGGEGLSGLARAFFFAGARSLLVSHWEVDDQATSRLMTTAFRHLDRNHAGGRSEALQRAMQAVRRDPRFVDPRFWGAFTLVGDAR